MSGNWRYLHVVTDEFPGNVKAAGMYLARLGMRQMHILSAYRFLIPGALSFIFVHFCDHCRIGIFIPHV